ncbi:MAG: hypothetical protein J6S67_21820 [Methanobrevibacter sp.]|nr:hypothetical protein [Methanobrevibacter sp.]
MICGTLRHFKSLPKEVRQEIIEKLSKKDDVVIRCGNEKYYFHKDFLKDVIDMKEN